MTSKIVSKTGTMTLLTRAKAQDGQITVALLKWTPKNGQAVYRVLYNDYRPASLTQEITEYPTSAEARDAAKKLLRR